MMPQQFSPPASPRPAQASTASKKPPSQRAHAQTRTRCAPAPGPHHTSYTQPTDAPNPPPRTACSPIFVSSARTPAEVKKVSHDTPRREHLHPTMWSHQLPCHVRSSAAMHSTSVDATPPSRQPNVAATTALITGWRRLCASQLRWSRCSALLR